MDKIATEEVMDNLDMIQSRFGKIYEFGQCYFERISADAGIKYTSTEFKEECQTRSVHFALADMEHQEMNVQVEVTWRTLLTISQSLMVHERVSEAYINFSLMYTTDHIFWY